MSTLGRRATDQLHHVEVAVIVAWAAMAAGTLVRLQQFAHRRSLWTDEAALAVNIVQRDFGGLLQPLDGNQGSPALFLFAERALVLVGGNNEYALRVVPLLAGVALLPLVHLTARRLGSPVTAAAATLLAAFSPSLVRYSTEVKQYSSDAAIAVGLVLLAMWANEAEQPRIALAGLAGVGAVAIWGSHPAVFVLAGIGSVLLARAVRCRRWDEVTRLGAVGALWLASAGVLYVVSLRGLERNEFLTTYWQDGFPPRPLELGSALRWPIEAAVRAMADPVGLALPALALVLCGVGLRLLGRRHRLGATMLVGFAPFLFLAAAAERYPVRGRLVLFVVPLVLIGLAGLVEARRWRAVGIGALVLVATGGLVDVARVVADPPEFAASRPVFQHVGSHWIEGDEVWVHDVTVEPYRYYGPIVGVHADRRTRWSGEGPCSIEAQGRVWVVFAYTLSSRPHDEADRLRSHLARRAEVVSVIERPDASVTLFDFDHPPAATTDDIDPDPDLGCITTSPEPPVARSGLSTGPFGTGTTS